MNNFFNPRSVAIIGASDQPDKIGAILISNLQAGNYSGEIFPVNPNHDQIGGIKCYGSVSQIDKDVDLAIIAIPAKFVCDALKDCASKSIKNVIVISAGFGEAGKEGAALEKQLSDIAQENHILLLGPNCLGSINATLRLNFSFSKNNFPSGSIALIMQSGAFTTALFDLAKKEGLGFSLVSTLGNKAVLDESDFAKYFATDSNTKVIGMYIEDIKNGNKFVRALADVSSDIPVVILKAGNSEKSQQAIQSHTGAMAGQADVTREVISEAGAIPVENLFEFSAALKMLGGFKQLRSNQLAIVTNAGGPGVIMTDLIESDPDLQLIELPDDLKSDLKKVLPSASSVANPIDLLGDANVDRYGQAITRLAETAGLGAIIAIVTPQAQTKVNQIYQFLNTANSQLSIPIVPVIMSSETFDLPGGVPSFIYPLQATKGLSLAFGYANRKKYDFDYHPKTDPLRSQSTLELYNQAKKDGRNVFYYSEACQLAELYGLTSLKATETTDADFAKMDYPVVLKVDSPRLIHKNAKGALKLGIKDAASLQGAIDDLSASFPDEKMIIQKQLEPGFELILGLKKNPQFGHVLMLGIGGIFTEILNKKMLWLLPKSPQDISKKLQGSDLAAILEKQSTSLELVTQMLERVAILAAENPWIEQFDINPLIVYKDNRTAAIDIKVLF